MSLNERSASLLMDVIFLIEDELCKHGIKKANAELIARNTCDKLRHTFGGENFYFPKGKELEALLTQHEVYKRFNGNNHVELSKEFDMSVQHIYRLVKEAHKKEIKERQPSLF